LSTKKKATFRGTGKGRKREKHWGRETQRDGLANECAAKKKPTPKKGKMN